MSAPHRPTPARRLQPAPMLSCFPTVSWRPECFEVASVWTWTGLGPYFQAFLLVGNVMESEALSLDESLPPSDLLNVPQSTPKTRKNELLCPYCSKKYVSPFYYRKHVGTHTHNLSSTSTTATPLSSHTSLVNATLIGNIDVSDVEVSLSQLADVTARDDNNNNSIQTPVFKKPTNAVPKKKSNQGKTKPKPKIICTYCLKGYICTRSYKNHMRTHAIQDAASRFPDKAKVLSSISEISRLALKTVSYAPSSGECGQLFNNFVAYLIASSTGEEWKTFSKSCGEILIENCFTKKILLPSALLKSVFDQVECLLSNSERCCDLLTILKIPDNVSQDIQCYFLLEFVLIFAKELIAFISKTFRESYPRQFQRPPTVLDHEDRQVIYYIGGSVMRGYFRIAYRYKKNMKWAGVVRSLQSRVLCDKPCHDQDASWTKAVDRGGLLFIKPECQKFLIALTPIVYACEQRDGSVDYDEVIRKVSNTDVSVLWDNMIFDSLSVETSTSLMNDVITCFSRTCVRGFAKRRLNFLKERPTVSMPLRHAVAKRKK